MTDKQQKYPRELGTRIDHETSTYNDIKVNENIESNAEATDNKNEDDSNEEDEDVDDEEDDESDADTDDLSDLKQTDSEEESESIQTKKNQTKKSLDRVAENGESEKINQLKQNLEVDLPFTVDMPTTYKQFSTLIGNRKAAEQATIIERLIKCNHPKLIGVNRENVVKLFAFLLQYINEMFADATQDNIATQFAILDKLNPYLYDLVHLNPEKMSVLLFNVIKEKYDEFRKNSKVFPGLETAIFLKLVSNFYSTSDFRHCIVTPCYIIIQHILSKARVRTCQDISIGLFLVTIALEFSQHSKRFLPAVFNYLLGMLYLSIPKRPVEVFKILPPFQSSGPMSIILAIPNDLKDENITDEMMLSLDLVTTTFSTEFKIRALNTTLKLIEDAINNIGDTIGSNYIAEKLLEMLERLPVKSYPTFVHKNYDSAMEAVKVVAGKTLTKIVPPEKRPRALRLLEPRIETVYDDKRRPKLSKEKEERAKLMHKLRRETKGAIREIRRDTEFIQNMRIRQQIQSDKERHEKVKRIYQEASVQQSELNELSRAKKKKKF
ncbi:nucleolar protein 14 homolog [Teleopsis dalmanni]|uniref:nucleolar protein 14 homolog n=1 Tax=Teleopsis dalmanni TaxID=139649 RepID=UPI0018CE2F47|nr:nucleolar protein 14 homolog [Teleopsis dalmanni]